MPRCCGQELISQKMVWCSLDQQGRRSTVYGAMYNRYSMISDMPDPTMKSFVDSGMSLSMPELAEHWAKQRIVLPGIKISKRQCMTTSSSQVLEKNRSTWICSWCFITITLLGCWKEREASRNYLSLIAIARPYKWLQLQIGSDESDGNARIMVTKAHYVRSLPKRNQ